MSEFASVMNRTLTFKLSDYISDQLHQNYLGERSFDAMRPRSHFTDCKRLQHALNHIKSRQQKIVSYGNRVRTEPDDRPVTVHFERTAKTAHKE